MLKTAIATTTFRSIALFRIGIIGLPIPGARISWMNPRYPNPASLITEMHNANVHTMISIWPEYQYTSAPLKAGDQDNYNALNNIGALYPSGGTHHFYDTFNASARTLVYQQIYNRLLGNYGWDGIWADNTEPQPYPDSVNMRTVNTALGKGVLNINAYPLQHGKALYEGWRSIGPNTNVSMSLPAAHSPVLSDTGPRCGRGTLTAILRLMQNRYLPDLISQSRGYLTGPPISAVTGGIRAVWTGPPAPVTKCLPAGSSMALFVRFSASMEAVQENCTAASGAPRPRPTSSPSTICATA